MRKKIPYVTLKYCVKVIWQSVLGKYTRPVLLGKESRESGDSWWPRLQPIHLGREECVCFFRLRGHRPRILHRKLNVNIANKSCGLVDEFFPEKASRSKKEHEKIIQDCIIYYYCWHFWQWVYNLTGSEIEQDYSLIVSTKRSFWILLSR